MFSSNMILLNIKNLTPTYLSWVSIGFPTPITEDYTILGTTNASMPTLETSHGQQFTCNLCYH